MALLTGLIHGNNPDSPNGYTEGPSYSHFNGPVARVNGNGIRRMKWVAVGLRLAGRYANRTAALYIANGDGSGLASTSDFTVPSGGGTQYVNGSISKLDIGDGGQMRLGYWHTSSGLFNFGAKAGAGTVYNNFGNYGDRALTGAYNWAQCPAAPNLRPLELLPGGQVKVMFDGSSDNGGLAVEQWVLQYAQNSAFTASPVSVISSGTSILTLQPATTYWFRAAGRNDVVSPYGEVGVWSNVRSATMIGGGKIRRSSAWVDAEPKIRDAGAWKDAKVKVRDNGLWVPAQ